MEDEKKNSNADTQTATESDVKNTEQVENKNEGEKTKKAVAQKAADGSIVFKNQDELDGFISRMYAKGAKKAEQSDTANETQKVQTNKEEETSSKEQVVPQDYLSVKIALAMAKAGVNAERVERAARLVDTTKILENGAISDKLLEDEINSVVAEFPELKNTKEEEKEEKGFKFGATQSEEKSEKNKRPVAQKRWNRFNSF